MPRVCAFNADLAGALEDDKHIREIFRHRKSLLGWQRDAVVGLPSLSALGFNTRVMQVFAEVYTKAQPQVKSPPVAWIRREAMVSEIM